MSKLSRNILYNLAGQLAMILVGFVATRQIYQQLPADVLGIYYFALAINLVLMQVSLGGMGALIVREVASTRDGGTDATSPVVQTASLLFWAVYVVLTAGSVMLGPWITSHWIELSQMDAESATLVFQILMAGVLSAIVATLYQTILRGFEDMAFTNLILVAGTLVRQIGIVVLLNAGADAVQTAIWISVSFWLFPISLYIRCLYFVPWRSLSIPKWHTEVAARNRSMAAKLVTNSGLEVIQFQADKIVISALLPVATLGIYSFLSNLVTRVGQMRNAVGSASLPTLSTLVSLGQKANVLSLYRKLEDLMVYGTMPLFGALAFGLLPIITYVFTAEIAAELLLPGLLLIVGFYLRGISTPARQIAIAEGRPELIRQSNLVSVVFSVPSAIVLIYYWGLNGAGFASLITGATASLYLAPKVYAECLQLPVGKWYSHLGKVSLLTTFTYGLVGVTLFLMGWRTVIALALGYLVASALFAGGALLLVDRDTIDNMLGMIKRGRSVRIGDTSMPDSP